MVQSQLAADVRLLVYESTTAERSESMDDTTTLQPESIEQGTIRRHHIAIPGIEGAHTLVCVEHAG
jgi:hypothetical protein